MCIRDRQCLIFDSVFNSFRGIIAYFKICNGRIKTGDKILDPRDTYECACQWEEKAKDLAGLVPEGFQGNIGYGAGEVTTFNPLNIHLCCLMFNV